MKRCLNVLLLAVVVAVGLHGSGAAASIGVNNDHGRVVEGQQQPLEFDGQPWHLATDPDTPPPGARCTGHALSGSKGLADQIFLNSTVLPLTWNISSTCPLMPPTKWVCCQAVQFGFLTTQLMMMSNTFKGCKACQDGIRNMWCHYTCSPFQGLYDTPMNVSKETGQILQTQLNVTTSFADRLWQSCKTAIFAQFEVKVMFPSIHGLFGAMAAFSPPVHGELMGHLIKDVYVVNASDVGSTALNATTVENDFYCSRPHPPRDKRAFALPKATIGGLRTESVVGIILGLLLIITFSIGLANAQHSQEDHEEAERESLASQSSSRVPHEDDIASMSTLDSSHTKRLLLDHPPTSVFAGKNGKSHEDHDGQNGNGHTAHQNGSRNGYGTASTNAREKE